MKKKNFRKYGNRKPTFEGVTWDSHLEYGIWLMLKRDQEAGLITNLTRQVKVNFFQNPNISTVIDFSFYEHGRLIYAEAKGVNTPVWALKKKLWVHRVGHELRIYKGSWRRPFLKETVCKK